MADQAGHGPDLGNGHIQLACRSQCPVSWHNRWMWDPNNSPLNELATIKSAVQCNPLQLFNDLNQYGQITYNRTIPADGQLEQQLQALQAKDTQTIKQLKTELSRLREQLINTEQLSRQYQKLLTQQKRGYQSNQTEITHLIKDTGSKHQNNLTQLQKTITEGIEKKYRHQLNEHQKLIDASGLRTEQLKNIIKQQQHEIELLQKNNQQLTIHDVNDKLEQLSTQGVMLMVYHAGLGHTTIPTEDADGYLADSIAYVAKRCSVSKKHYLRWLNHYENVSCDASVNGKRCGKSIVKIEKPRSFILGKSNKCANHQFLKNL